MVIFNRRVEREVWKSLGQTDQDEDQDPVPLHKHNLRLFSPLSCLWTESSGAHFYWVSSPSIISRENSKFTELAIWPNDLQTVSCFCCYQISHSYFPRGFSEWSDLWTLEISKLELGFWFFQISCSLSLMLEVHMFIQPSFLQTYWKIYWVLNTRNVNFSPINKDFQS